MKINTNWCAEDGYNQERLHEASEFVASFRRKWNIWPYSDCQPQYI